MQQLTIIGAGIVGLASALQLQHSGVDVLLLDRQPPGSGCSKGNAGHFATEQVFPLASLAVLKQLPAMLLDPTGPLRLRAGYLLQALPWLLSFTSNVLPGRQQQLSDALKSLNGPSIHSWRQLANLAGSEDLLRYQGALLVSEQANALDASLRSYQQAGVAVKLLSRDETLAQEPALAERVQAALEFPEVAHTVDPHALCQRLYQAFVAQGGRFLQLDVQQLVKTAGGFSIKTNGVDIDTQQLMIAAGAYSHLLCRQLGWQVPLEAERGYHLMTCPRPLHKPVSSLERKFIMTPMQHGLRLAGTVEFAGLDGAPDMRRADVLLQHANALLRQPTLAQGKPDAQWFGNRPSLPDSLPVLGGCPNNRGLWFNFGHQHLGLTQAAFSAQLLTSAVLGAPAAVDLTPFRINRF